MLLRTSSLLIRRVALLLCFAATLPSIAVTAAAPIPVTVCFPIDGNYYQVMYLPKYYTYNYIQPKVKIVGFVETPATTPRGVTLALAQNGTDCYVYIGPTNSAIALNVNAVMNSVWMAYSVTATEFSDRINYPLFSRAIPTVDVNERAITTLMKQFQWTRANILCTDNAYGQAGAAAVSKILTAAGGSALATCIPQFGTYANAASVVQNALESGTRVLMIVSNTGEATYTYGVQAINNLDVNRQLIVIFAEPVCTKLDPLWKTVPGAFCAVFTPNSDYDDFYNSFLTRDTQPEKDVAAAISGLTYSTATANLYAGYSALAVDGARLVYRALDNYVGTYGKLPPSIAAAVAVVRNQTLPDGFFGPIEIPNGDRLRPTMMRIYNSVPGNTTRVVANFTSDGNITFASSFFLLGKNYAMADVPPAVDPVPPASAAQPYWVIAIVGGVLIIIAVPAAYVARQKQLLAVRPMDPAAPFAVMFVGVKNVDEVRDAGDANSAAAFAQVANDLRAAVRASGCYEARRVDESTVMVVAKKVDNVLQCASQLMASMDRVDWQQVMCHANEMAMLALQRNEQTVSGGTRSRRSHQSRNSHARVNRQVPKKKLSNAALESSTNESLRRSTMLGTQRSSLISQGSTPLLHVGIHYGFGMIDHDDSLNTVSYVGKVVSRAAEVADVAVAGQILVSREAQDAAETAVGTDGTFERFDAFVTIAPDTVVFIPTTLSQESVLAMRAATKRAIETADKNGGVVGGTIAAALQRADAGLSVRRIAVLSLRVPLVLDVPTNTAKIPIVADLIDEVTSIAAVHRGEIHSMSNGTILITVNAGAPAAQPVARAALIAMTVLEYLDSQQLSGSAGVAGGLALVGRPTQGAAFATFSTAVELAEVAQRMAAKHGLKVCAVDTNSYDDLATRLHVATIDIVPNAGSRDGISRLLAVIGERDATAGEWLYSVGEANAGLSANEHAWQQVLQSETPSPDTLRLIETCEDTSDMWKLIAKLSLQHLNARVHSPLEAHLPQSPAGSPPLVKPEVV